VRAGSIIPTGPAIQYTGEEQNPVLTIAVYTGANGVGSIYEDDGISRQYLQGKYARIPLAYDQRTHSLTIGARQGSYPGMAATRTIRIRWMIPGRPRNLDDADQTVTYLGAATTIRMPD
jgi:alpha-D-xyloside xylohydrolase